MVFRIPQEFVVDSLPMMTSVQYVASTTVEKQGRKNALLARLLPPLLGNTTGCLQSVHQTLEYIRYAHQITGQPQIVQCPRDDSDPRRVQNLNDMIRVLVCQHTRKRTARQNAGPFKVART
jgi:hypothetical protein